jgi:hypothetical protein
MTIILESWPRKLYQQTSEKFYFRYRIYGEFPPLPAFSSTEYRSAGLFKGVKLFRYDQHNASQMSELRSGNLWEQSIGRNPALDARILMAQECLELKADFADQPNLDYLRDTVGLIMFLLENGGCAVYDYLSNRWWDALSWRRDIFSQPFSPRIYLNISKQINAGKITLLTSGLVIFARQEIKIIDIPEAEVDSAKEIIYKLAVALADGAVLQDGQEIRTKTLAKTLICNIITIDKKQICVINW